MKKRLFVFLMILTLIFTLSACGKSDEESNSGKNDKSGTTSESGDKTGDTNDKDNDTPLSRRDDETPVTTKTPTPVDNDDPDPGDAQGISSTSGLTLESLIGYVETGSTDFFTPHVLTPAEEAELRANVEAAGGTLNIDGDGTIHITGNGSSSLVISPDGAVSGVDEDGQSFGVPAGLNSKDWPTSAFGKAVPKADFDIQMQFEDEESLMIMFNNVTYDEAKAYCKKLAEYFTLDPQELDMKENGICGFSGHNSDGIDVEFNYINSNGTNSCALSVGKYIDYSNYGDYGDYGDYDYGDYDYGDYDYGDYDYGDYDYGDYDYGDLNGYGIGTTTEWPSTGLLTMLPEPDFGTGYTIEELPEYAYVVVQGAGRSDFTPYVNKLKQAGFNKNVDTDAYEDVMFFEATNDDGYVVFVQSVNGSFEFGIGIPD